MPTSLQREETKRLRTMKMAMHIAAMAAKKMAMHDGRKKKSPAAGGLVSVVMSGVALSATSDETKV